MGIGFQFRKIESSRECCGGSSQMQAGWSPSSLGTIGVNGERQADGGREGPSERKCLQQRPDYCFDFSHINRGSHVSRSERCEDES